MNYSKMYPMPRATSQLMRRRVPLTLRIYRPFAAFSLIVFFLICLYSFTIVLESNALASTVNLLGPAILGAAAVVTGLRILRSDPLSIWTPSLWFLGSVLLFYSIGSLIYPLGNEKLLSYLELSLRIHVSQYDLLRTNLLNAVGIFSICLGLCLAQLIKPRRPGNDTAGPLQQFKNIKVISCLLLIMGGILKYLVTLPYQFGGFDVVLPGVISNLSNLYLFGLMGASYLAASGFKRWRMALFLLWPIELFVSFLAFSKADLVLALILPPIGAYLAHRNMKRLIGWIIAASIVFVAVSNFIHYGRSEAEYLSGLFFKASLRDRINIVMNYDAGELGANANLILSPAETAWARLSYVHVQAFAMTQYDQGRPGETLKAALIVLIPRFFWPAKPVITDAAQDFYELVTGRSGETHLGLGIFGEAYWNAGWFGVVLIGLIAGSIFMLIGSYTVEWMKKGKIEYMPGIFIGINMGIVGPTELFASAFVGASGFIVVYSLIVSKFIHLLAQGITQKTQPR